VSKNKTLDIIQQNNFELKCKKCGNLDTDILISFNSRMYPDLTGADIYINPTVRLKCLKCGHEGIILSGERILSRISK